MTTLTRRRANESRSMIPGYQKVVAGPLIARETGLDAIRAECPRFAQWLARLESLGGLLKPAETRG